MASTKTVELKVILCGEYGVGKSSIFRRFATDTFTEANDRSSTLGLDNFVKYFEIENRSIKMQLWDTGGMERIGSITSSYYKFAGAALLIFSFDNPDSFNILSQHILEIVTHAEKALIFLCGNKIDLTSHFITDNDIEMFCEQCHNMISGIYKVSCKTNEGVHEMFNDIARIIIKQIKSKELLTKDSFQVRSTDQPKQTCNC